MKKQGTLKLNYLSNIKNSNVKDGDIVIFAVRKANGITIEGGHNVKALSPSAALFDKTKRWRKEDFYEKEFNYLKETGEYPDWWPLYEMEFERELKGRPDMVRALEKVKQRLEEGIDVHIICYCKSAERCHRGLIGRYLAEQGYDVSFN